ncbi:slime mold cyclic AMP receptor-domain-containing protein [Thamnocephalis sphaerospora]|uniref:Slime mold cyclic AMP receptor-domain-containing protein n=1 Tax=Thamnocephalis sphaerospora TaxID=78915 RepID=A0A4V1IXI0_9FUNG|nr:slime mold cyclic AMP receptor-domain-containing protein [Thamnocephalis sphaerospora]|eukprot:RKP11129.1 slime mold cyclic AMP receptor-domain-containing protein [Thamnocephalis sphaerospora]
MPVSDEQWELIGQLTMYLGIASFLGSLAIIISYWTVDSMRNGVAELIMFMSCTKLTSAIALIIGKHGPDAGESSFLCQMQSVFSQYGDFAAMVWSSFIAVDITLIMLRRYSVDQVCKLHRRVYLPICIALPLIIALLPIWVPDADGERFYGDAGGWCWFTEKNARFRFYLLYIPFWVIFVYNAVTYITIGIHIWRQARRLQNFTALNHSAHMIDYAKNVSLYMFSYVLTWTIPSINRIHALVSGDQVYILNLLQSIGDSTVGVVDLAIYLYIWRKSLWHKSYGSHMAGPSRDNGRHTGTTRTDISTFGFRGKQQQHTLLSTLEEYNVDAANMYDGDEGSAYRPPPQAAMGQLMPLETLGYKDSISFTPPAAYSNNAINR